MHQNEIVRKLSFQVLMGLLRSFRGHLKSFGDLKLKSDKRNRLSVQKNLEKDILHAPKWDLVRKLCFQVLMGHLRSFGGHLMTQKLNSDEHNRISIPKNLEKDILHAPRWNLVKKNYGLRSLIMLLRSLWGNFEVIKRSGLKELNVFQCIS